MDWIKARFACSLDHAWLVLKERLKADIAEWRTHSPADGAVSVSEDGDRLILSRAFESGPGPWATLAKTRDKLLLRSGPAPNSAREDEGLHPTLNAAGECRLVRDGEELEFWQASRLILEPLLFGD